jgi:hypothetical protein
MGANSQLAFAEVSSIYPKLQRDIELLKKGKRQDEFELEKHYWFRCLSFSVKHACI